MTKNTTNLLKKGIATFTAGFVGGEVLHKTVDRCRETAEKREMDAFLNGESPKAVIARKVCEGAKKLSTLIGRDSNSR